MHAHLQRRGTLREEWCALYAAEAALALEHIHKHQFVYRDLKVRGIVSSLPMAPPSVP